MTDEYKKGVEYAKAYKALQAEQFKHLTQNSFRAGFTLGFAVAGVLFIATVAIAEATQWQL